MTSFALAARALRLAALPFVAALSACGVAPSVPPEARLSTAFVPTWPAECYVEQANRYFDGLDLRFDPGIDLDSPWMHEAAASDREIADFVRRARDFWPTWLEALREAGPDYFARGCGGTSSGAP